MNVFGFLPRLVAVTGLLAATTLEAYALSILRAPGYVTIRGDRGGQIIDYAIKAKRIERSGQKVRFAGRCASACTLYLMLPARQTCVTRNASFGFHMPYGRSARSNKVAANYMMRSYPGWVRNWIRSNGGLSRRMKTMDHEYASRYLPSCDRRAGRST